MEAYAAWALRFLDAAGGAARVDVMGHSMGCQVALALAQKHPERVRRIVLLGATTGARHVSTLRNLAGLMGDSLREPLSYNLLLTRVFWRMGPLRYLLTVGKMQRDDAFRRAAAVAAPALVLQGARDRIVPKHVAQGLAKALPCAAYARVPGAAHAAQYSHPEETAALVLRFLVE
jgi:pimeloyl-ACP methyl ester carboxylesterase